MAFANLLAILFFCASFLALSCLMFAHFECPAREQGVVEKTLTDCLLKDLRSIGYGHKSNTVLFSCICSSAEISMRVLLPLSSFFFFSTIRWKYYPTLYLSFSVVRVCIRAAKFNQERTLSQTTVVGSLLTRRKEEQGYI